MKTKRKIKFRGQRLGTNEWVYGNLLIEDNYTYIAKGSLHIEVNPETIGQFTGLKDRKGVDIYEGDELYYVYECPSILTKFPTIEALRGRDTSQSPLAYDIGTVEYINGHYLLLQESGDCNPISDMFEHIMDEQDEHQDHCIYEVIDENNNILK